MEPADTVNPKIVASTDVDQITSAESINSADVLDNVENTDIHELQT